MKFPGLTGFIGRIMLSYFDNTTALNQVVKWQRQSSEDEESITESNQKRQREDTVWWYEHYLDYVATLFVCKQCLHRALT